MCIMCIMCLHYMHRSVNGLKCMFLIINRDSNKVLSRDLPQKQLIFRVLRNIDKVSARKMHTMLSFIAEIVRVKPKTKKQLPQIGLWLVTHSQSLLFGHNKNCRGTISLGMHTNSDTVPDLINSTTILDQLCGKLYKDTLA